MQSNTPTLQLLPHEAVAVAAYYHWIEAGQPSGRDQEFWLKAEGQLRNMMAVQATAMVEAPGTKQAAQPIGAARSAPATGSRRVNGPIGCR